MFKLEIPKKYIDMFEMIEINQIELKIDNLVYKIQKEDILLNGRKYFNQSTDFPFSWQKLMREEEESIEPKLLKDILENRSVIIKKNSTIIVVIKYFDGYLEVSNSGSKAIVNMEMYVNLLVNHYNINSYIVHELSFLDEYVFEIVYRYFIYQKNWYDCEGSSGGGNITSLLTKEEIDRRIRSGETYQKVGSENYRLKDSFIKQCLAKVDDEYI